MDSNGDSERFLRLLKVQLDGTGQLLDVLETENRALRARDTDLLQQSTATKESLLRELRRLTAAHDRFLTTRGLAPGKAGSLAFLRGLPEDAEAHGIWHRLREAAGVCRERNEVNGSILAASRARIQRSLEILRGTPDHGKTYGKAGQTFHGGRSKILGTV